MKVLIIEDEKPAAEKLHKALLKISNGIEVLSILESVQDTIHWMNKNPSPQLIFMDIQVADGPSFKIFEQKNIECPVIFVTAYDEYWQTSFEHNGIDYLLKPIRHEKLEAAVNKYHMLKQHFAVDYSTLLYKRKVTESSNGYKKRLLVKKGVDYFSIKTDEIAYFYATHKVVCLLDKNGQKFILDKSLSDIEKDLDPMLFFRVNRKYLVNMNAIRRIKAFPKSKLLVELTPPVEEEVLISPETAGDFKHWLGS